jgi:hypothetical protein
MRKQFLISLLAPSLIFGLSACSGGGGGSSSPSTAVPQYIKKPTANCGSKDCFSGAAVSSLSIGTLSVEGDATYTSAKNEYDSVKGLFTDTGKVGYVVQLLNAAANENDIAACDDIPTSGTFSFGGYDFTLASGGESWSLSGAPVAMTHQITGVDANSNVQYNFNCDATVQRLHIITKDLGTGSKAEVYSERNLVTGETHIEVADDSSGKSLFYFSSNGGDKFTLAHLSYNAGSASSLLVTSDVLNPPQADASSQYIEVVQSGASNADLDTADWGFNLHGGAANSYRGCIMNYRSSSSATSYDNSCNASTVVPPGNMGTQYALLSNLPPLLVGDGIAVTSWSVIGLNTLVIPDP